VGASFWEAPGRGLRDDGVPGSLGSMPFVETGPVKLYYESRGRGPAVLLVMGLGMTLSGWWRTVPVLARSFRVLTFDNRGIGRSDSAALPYSVAAMADDAIAVLDAAGEQRAHVYGISLGGMVAQELALRHPDRVRALVLGATTPGGSRGVLAGVPALGFFSRAAAMAPEEALWAAVPYTYAETTRRRHAERIAEDIAHRVRFPPDPSAYGHQVAAAATHNTFHRLGEIAAPTLVVHGEEDAVVPPQHARLLAEAILGAELRLWPEAGHLYVTDEPHADREIARFLRRQTRDDRVCAASRRRFGVRPPPSPAAAVSRSPARTG
jgi:3-oxoadipate enol-lactonase